MKQFTRIRIIRAPQGSVPKDISQALINLIMWAEPIEPEVLGDPYKQPKNYKQLLDQQQRISGKTKLRISDVLLLYCTDPKCREAFIAFSSGWEIKKEDFLKFLYNHSTEAWKWYKKNWPTKTLIFLPEDIEIIDSYFTISPLELSFSEFNYPRSKLNEN